MSDRGPLLILENEWLRSFQEKDRAFLESFLAEESRLSFVDDERAPTTFPREAWFTNFDGMTFSRATIFDPQEVIFGKVGVIHFNIRFENWIFEGKVLPCDYTVTDVFIFRDERWQLTNRISEPWV